MPLDMLQFQAAIKQIENEVTVLDRVRRRIANAKLDVQGAFGGDPYPTSFWGIIEGYRFTTGAKGARPTHRFEVKCGNGIMLHLEVGTTAFDRMMLDMTMGEITPGKVNGKLVLIVRTEDGIMIPRKMYDKEPYSRRDKYGNYIFDGAPVLVPSSGILGTTLRVNEAGSINVRFEDESDENYLAGDLIVRL